MCVFESVGSFLDLWRAARVFALCVSLQGVRPCVFCACARREWVVRASSASIALSRTEDDEEEDRELDV